MLRSVVLPSLALAREPIAAATTKINLQAQRRHDEEWQLEQCRTARARFWRTVFAPFGLLVFGAIGLVLVPAIGVVLWLTPRSWAPPSPYAYWTIAAAWAVFTSSMRRIDRRSEEPLHVLVAVIVPAAVTYVLTWSWPVRFVEFKHYSAAGVAWAVAGGVAIVMGPAVVRSLPRLALRLPWRIRQAAASLTAPPSSPPPLDLPQLRIANPTCAVAWFVHATRVVLTEGQVQRQAFLTAFERGVDAMDVALANRRFAGFWNAVESATASLADVRRCESALARCAQVWLSATPLANGAEPIGVALTELRAWDKAEQYTIAFDDGSTATFTEGRSLYSSIRFAAPKADGAIASFRTASLEPDTAEVERFSRAYGRYAELLEKADGDYEMASIGQQFRLRAALEAGFERLEQAIYSLGASITTQIRDSERAIISAVHTSANAVAGAIHQQTNDLQRSLGSIDSSVRRIQTLYAIRG